MKRQGDGVCCNLCHAYKLVYRCILKGTVYIMQKRTVKKAWNRDGNSMN